MLNLKKILLIILFIAIIFGIGFAIYYVFFKPEKPPEEIAPTIPERPPIERPGLPTAMEAAPIVPSEAPLAAGEVADIPALETEPVLGAALTDGERVNYYNTADGKFYKINPDGSIETLSDKVFYNVINVVWSPKFEEAILEYPDGSNILYNFETEKQATLPRHWQEFDFSPDGKKIAAKSMGMDADNRWLIIANPDGTESQVIEPMGDKSTLFQVRWSSNGQIVAFAKNSDNIALSSQEILFVGLRGENFKSITVPGMRFEGRWSPGGAKLLYSVTSGASNYLPLLWITDAGLENIGANRRSLGINTWAEKCVFSDENALYCAIPTNLPRGAGLQPAMARNPADSIWKIDLNTGLRTVVIVPSTSMNIFSLNLSRDRNSLYFVDRITSTIRKIRLK